MTMRAEVPTGVVTVLLGDVEGSVRRWESDRAEMGAAMAALSSHVDEAVGSRQGYRPVEQGEGDSFVAAFVRPADAIAAALDIQLRLAEEPGGLRVRMAVHSQEAQLRDPHNYEGALMHRAARVRALAYGRQVLVSATTRSLVVDALPPETDLIDLGSHHLRDIDEPERVFQLTHPRLPSEFPPLRTPDALMSNLPAQVTTFVGRTNELRAVTKLLQENRLVSLTGPGGVGKTRLAVEAASQAGDSYPHGVWFVDLSVVNDPAMVGSAVATALRARDDITVAPVDTISARLSNDAALIVLDNCEQVIGSAATLVDGILRRCPHVRVLVTSREPLSVGGEATYAVPSLDLPLSVREVDNSTLAAYDAVRLFADRAYRADSSFELDGTTIPLVGSICAQVDALPLAIELAAARLRVMPIGAVAESVADRFRMLDGGPRTAQRRQQSLRASVEWSHDLLDSGERALFRRLGVFAASFTFGAVEAIGGGDPLAPEEVDATFISLVDKSLVTRVAGGRYRLLEAVRPFARERLAESGDDEAELRRRHLTFLVELTERLEAGDSDEWMAQVEAELADVDQAISFAQGQDKLDALRVAASVSRYCFLSFTSGAGLRRLDAAEPEDSAAVGPELRAKTGLGRAYLSLICGDQARAMSVPYQLSEARGHFETVGDRRGVASVDALRYALQQRLGNDDGLREKFDSAVAELSDLGDKWSAAFFTAVWGSFLVFIGRPKEGAADLARAAEMSATKSSIYLTRYVQTWQATAHGMMGEHRDAVSLGQRCLSGMADARDTDMKAFLLGIVGNGYWELGDLDAAESYGRRAADLSARYGHAAHEALGHALVGRVAFTREDFELARTCFERAIDIVAEREQRHLVARHACWLADANTALRRVDDSRAAIARGMEAVSHLGPSADRVRLLLATARLERLLGDDNKAEDEIHRALPIVKEVGGRQTAVTAFELLALIAEAAESDIEAVRYFGAASSQRKALGRSEGRARVDLAMARERLGREAFDKALAEGEAMTLEEAIAYAARGRGARKRPSTGWASLTPTEMDVVTHVAAGLTNPGVGAKMFISPATVRTHLSHIFTKLGVSSRSQLAAEFARRA